jgi:hypothetical protein
MGSACTTTPTMADDGHGKHAKSTDDDKNWYCSGGPQSDGQARERTSDRDSPHLTSSDLHRSCRAALSPISPASSFSFIHRRFVSIPAAAGDRVAMLLQQFLTKQKDKLQYTVENLTTQSLYWAIYRKKMVVRPHMAAVTSRTHRLAPIISNAFLSVSSCRCVSMCRCADDGCRADRAID